MNIIIILPTKFTMPTKEEFEAREGLEKVIRERLHSGHIGGHDEGDYTMRIFVDDIDEKHIYLETSGLVIRLNEAGLLRKSAITFR